MRWVKSTVSPNEMRYVHKCIYINLSFSDSYSVHTYVHTTFSHCLNIRTYVNTMQHRGIILPSVAHIACSTLECKRQY